MCISFFRKLLDSLLHISSYFTWSFFLHHIFLCSWRLPSVWAWTLLSIGENIQQSRKTTKIHTLRYRRRRIAFALWSLFVSGKCRDKASYLLVRCLLCWKYPYYNHHLDFVLQSPSKSTQIKSSGWRVLSHTHTHTLSLALSLSSLPSFNPSRCPSCGETSEFPGVFRVVNDTQRCSLLCPTPSVLVALSLSLLHFSFCLIALTLIERYLLLHIMKWFCVSKLVQSLFIIFHLFAFSFLQCTASYPPVYLCNALTLAMRKYIDQYYSFSSVCSRFWRVHDAYTPFLPLASPTLLLLILSFSYAL